MYNNRMQGQRVQSRAFTLLELLIVLLIVGILIAIGLYKYQGVTEVAHNKDAQAALRAAYIHGEALRATSGGIKYAASSTSLLSDLNSQPDGLSFIEWPAPPVAPNTWSSQTPKNILVSYQENGEQIVFCNRAKTGRYFCLLANSQRELILASRTFEPPTLAQFAVVLSRTFSSSQGTSLDQTYCRLATPTGAMPVGCAAVVLSDGAGSEGWFGNFPTKTTFQKPYSTTPSFAAAVKYSDSTQSPAIIISGDFTGDGKMDLATTSYNTVTPTLPPVVSVFPGNGNGTFGAALSTPITGNSYGTAAGDFNNDGKLDIVAAYYSPGYAILLNNGNGTFTKTDYTTTGVLYDVKTADMDNDGKVDLVLNNAGDRSVMVLFGSGTGTFAARNDNYTTLADQAYCVDVADLNNDGKLDLIAGVSGTPNRVEVFLNNGNRTFASPTTYPVGSLPFDIELVDLNKDGKVDLISADTNTGVSVLLGNGNGTFAARTETPLVGFNPKAVVSGEFNGDGKTDVAVVGTNGGLTAFLGDGTGAIGSPVNYPQLGSGRSMVAVDLNNDQKVDLATAHYNANHIAVWLNNLP